MTARAFRKTYSNVRNIKRGAYSRIIAFPRDRPKLLYFAAISLVAPSDVPQTNEYIDVINIIFAFRALY